MSYTTEDILIRVIESTFSRYDLQDYVDALGDILAPYMHVAGLRCNLYANKSIYKVVEYKRSDFIVPTPDILRIPEQMLVQFYRESSVDSNPHTIKVINGDSPVSGYREIINMIYGGPADSIYLPLEHNSELGMALFLTIYTLNSDQYTQQDVELCKLLQRPLVLAVNRIIHREKLDWMAFADDPKAFRFTSKSNRGWAEPRGENFHDTQEQFVSLDEYIKNYISRSIRHTKGRIAGKKGAAQLLGLPISTLWSKIRKYNIAVSAHPEE